MNAIDLSRADWRKSSHSGQDGNCVEVAWNLPSVVAIRDSKAPSAATVVVSPQVWRRFVSGLGTGQA